MTRVAIVGAGYTDFRSITPEVSWKEIMYKAASRAYHDAGLDPRRDEDSFITCAEDYWEGFSIFDEFTPDQVGAALRSMITTCGDGIHGLANTFMQIETGFMGIVVESHSGISDSPTYLGAVLFAFNPIYYRPSDGHLYCIDRPEMGEWVTEFHPILEEKGKEVTKILVWTKEINWVSYPCCFKQRGWSKTIYIKSTSENTQKIVVIRVLFSESYASPISDFSIGISDELMMYVVLKRILGLHRTLDTILRLKEQSESQQMGCKIIIRILERDNHN